MRVEVAESETDTGSSPWSGLRVGALAASVFLAMLPVTMPVPVLRGLVHDRFAVGEALTSLFMAVNMIGAVLAAPLVGVLADRLGERRRPIVAALLLDGALLWLLTQDVPFAVFLGVRFVEGMAHIGAVSLLLALAADGAGARRGRVMGAVGAALTFGVALGAALGGRIGNEDPLLPLQVGAVLLGVAAAVTAVALRDAPLVRRARSSRAALRRLLEDRPLLAPLAFAFVDRFTVGFFTTTFPLAMKRLYDLEPARIGMLLALFLVPFAALSWPCGRLAERTSRSALMVGGSLLYGVAVASFVLWSGPALPGWMLLLGVLSAVMFVPSLLLAVDLAPVAGRGAAMGAFNAAGSLGFIVGPIVGGVTSEMVAHRAGWETGYAVAFGVAGGAELVCVLATVPLLVRLRRQGRIT